MKSWLLPFLGTGGLLISVGITGLGTYAALIKPLPEVPVQTERGSNEPAAADARPHSRRVLSGRYYAAVTDRPLFSPSRRPLTKETTGQTSAEHQDQIASAAAAPPEVLKTPQFQLHGTLMTAGQPSALLSTPDSEPNWVTLGASVQGWQLDNVENGRVSLKNGNRTFELELY